MTFTLTLTLTLVAAALALALGTGAASAGLGCPALCQCRPASATASASAPEQLKLRCGGEGSPDHAPDHAHAALLSELKDVNLTDASLAAAVVNLNLSGNSITTLSRDLHMPNLQKLDLSDNKISLIESDAFYNLTGLQKLDLSGNAVQNIYKEIFKGLVNLERLLLGRNNISSLAYDTFDHLLGLKQLDISGNPLKCDCDLLWISEWSKSTNVKLMGSPKCAQPKSLTGQSIKKLKILLDLVKCGILPNSLPNALLLHPRNGQLVFEGDSLTLRCKAPFSTIKTAYNLTWTLPLNNTGDIVITNTDVLEEGLAETVLKINHILNNHTGNYVCTYSKENSTDLIETIEIIVISNVTQYCPETLSSNNKGIYTWPQSVTGHTVSQPCHNIERGVAYYKCGTDKKWSQLNTSSCPYISETTKMLEQFAIVNLTVFKDSVVSACERLQTLLYKHTPPNGMLTDPDDVNFIARAIGNFMHYTPVEKDLGSILLDVINTVMSLPFSILKAAEDMYGSCSYFIDAIENISQYTSNIHGHKLRFAVENFAIKRESFTGITCVWYTTPDFAMDASNHQNRMLHCSTTNRTITPLLTVRDKIIEASIQIPGTLLYGIDDQMLSLGGTRNIHRSYNLIVSMFENANLFSKLPDIKNTSQFPHSERVWNYYGGKIDRTGNRMAITTPVVGIKLVNMTINHLLREPVYIMVRDTGISSGGRAVLWDEELKHWTDSSEGCSIIRIIANMVVIQCYKLGYVGLMQSVETGIYGGRSAGARFKLSHPAIYVGSTILMVCLLVTLLTYIISYSAIHMAAKSKHSLINTWLALSVLCFLYTLGIYQTEDIQLCQGIGLMLHYLTLCCLFWMTVSVSQLYKYLTKNQNDPLHTPDDEIPPEVPIQKPILGIYLVGWGISLIVCGISGAVNMRDYASYSHCFLSTAPALSAVFVPAVIIIAFISILFLLVRCSIQNINGQLSDGTQATENVDLETWEPSLLVNNTNIDRISVKSGEESDFEDTEHIPLVQLRAYIIVLCLYLATWSCGTIAVYHPFPLYLPYQEDIFSILYAISATILGTFIVFFYGIARSDVRSQWQLMHCYFKKRKQCCRNRSVFDTNAHGIPASSHQNLPPVSNLAAAQARSRSNSQNSNRTNSKSNNSNILKAGAELNGQTMTDTMSSGKKIHNMNLVVLHRQQYRSNNSVTTCPQESVEMFYNPNQINVARKFFKRQRKHMRHNRLEIPRRHNYDSDSQVSNNHKICDNSQTFSSPFVSNSKVNNTNIHIDTEQTFSENTKIKLNSNILEQREENERSPLKHSTLEKDEHLQKDLEKNKLEKSLPEIIMNIYTNVPETQIPQHQIISTNSFNDQDEHSFSYSGDCTNDIKAPVMRTVSQQCSLEYSSTSEVATPINHLGSDKTLNTHSEVTSFPETHSAIYSTHEITSDTDEPQSFPPQHKSKKKLEKVNKSNSSKSVEECDKSSKSKLKRQNWQNFKPNYSEEKIYDEVASSCAGKYSANEKSNASENDELIVQSNNIVSSLPTPGKSRDYLVDAPNKVFDTESEIYFSNYQISEVSIQSHGLYAPQPPSICANDLRSTFSNGELSRTQPEEEGDENQYVNFNPAWRKVKERMQQPSPAVSLPDVNRADNDSPLSFASEIDELYKQIKGKPYSRRHYYAARHCESDSCISESHSDILDSEHKAETRV